LPVTKKDDGGAVVSFWNIFMIFLNCAVVGCVEKLKFLAYFKHCLLLVVKLEFFFQLKQFKAPSA
jgi:hypothetical protein